MADPASLVQKVLCLAHRHRHRHGGTPALRLPARPTQDSRRLSVSSYSASPSSLIQGCSRFACMFVVRRAHKKIQSQCMHARWRERTCTKKGIAKTLPQCTASSTTTVLPSCACIRRDHAVPCSVSLSRRTGQRLLEPRNRTVHSPQSTSHVKHRLLHTYGLHDMCMANGVSCALSCVVQSHSDS